MMHNRKVKQYCDEREHCGQNCGTLSQSGELGRNSHVCGCSFPAWLKDDSVQSKVQLRGPHAKCKPGSSAAASIISGLLTEFSSHRECL